MSTNEESIIKGEFDEYLEGNKSKEEISVILGISRRQVDRRLKRYTDEGIIGLKHKLCFKLSNHRISEDIKEQTLTLIRSKYYDFSPTLAAEHLLEEEGIKVHPETLRLWMKGFGLVHKTRKRKPYRQYRERKPCFGQMLQIDGSFHHWLDISWGDDAANSKYTGRLKVMLANEPGSLGKLSNAVARADGNIANLNIVYRTMSYFELLVDVDVKSLDHLKNIISALKASPMVSYVARSS